MSVLDEPLAAAAAYDGVVPDEVAEWVDDGAQPDPDGWPEEAESPAKRAGLWRITDLGAATWAMRRVRAALRELNAIDDAYAEEKARLDKWREKAQRPHRNRVEWFEDRLGQWALALREADPKTATFPTPAGKVVTSKPSKPWKIELVDGSRLLAWALSNGMASLIRPQLQTLTAIRTVVSVAEADEDAKVVFAETGEVVPGLSAEATHTTYRVEVDQ